jgi:hypothetical protein
MDDNGNIIYYIILGAIYLLSRVFGKKKKKPEVAPPQKRNITPPTAESEEAPPLSFEDILRELSGNKQPKPEADPDPAFIPTPPSIPVREAAREQAYSVDEIDEIAVDYEVPKEIGWETSTSQPIKRKKLTFKRDEHFAIEEKITIDYLDILAEQDGAAKAFVMSEIFARKY